MAFNQSIEAPNFDKIASEAGQFTSDAIALLWGALIDTRSTERRDFRNASERIAPKVLLLAPSASVDNLDIQGASVLSFTGSTSVNVTGFRAPDTGTTRILFCQVSGTGTMTFKNDATSESQNRIILSTGADTARATNTGLILVYLASKWREVART